MQWIVEFIKSTAIPMTPPPAYGVFHLTFFIAGLLVCALLARLLRNSGERQNRRVLLAAGCLLLAFEIYKQVFQYVAVGYMSYPFGIFPFHICSTPMYLCIVAGLLRPGRLQSALMNYIGTFGFIGGFSSFFEPSGLSHGYWVQTLHSYTWHMVLIFLGFYLWASRRVGANPGEFRQATKVFLSLCVVAFAFNLIFYEASSGTISMFFLGPADANIIVFRGISERFGWYVSTPLLIGSMLLAGYLVYLPNYRRNTALRRRALTHAGA